MISDIQNSEKISTAIEFTLMKIKSNFTKAQASEWL